MTTGPVVLLEGASDVAAVRAVAEVLRVADAHVRYVDLGGVTNVRTRLEHLRIDEPGTDVVGMCDAGEASVVVRALEADGAWIRDVGDLPSYGFFVCHADLEDELIRALGPLRVLEVLDTMGLRSKLYAFQGQPAWRDRELPDQLRRFCGTTSGRKEILARELASALTPETVPEPLRLLVERLH